MLFTAHNLTSDQTVIVHSAAGGVGLAAVQIAKAAGARVIGTVSSDGKADVARKYGADEVINYAQNDFSEETRRIKKPITIRKTANIFFSRFWGTF